MIQPDPFRSVASLELGATLLDGSATDVWIFQIAQDLTVSSGTPILLAGGALSKNVFWQVAGLVDLGMTAHCEGIVLTQTAVTLQTAASINGRLLAQTALGLEPCAPRENRQREKAAPRNRKLPSLPEVERLPASRTWRRQMRRPPDEHGGSRRLSRRDPFCSGPVAFGGIRSDRVGWDGTEEGVNRQSSLDGSHFPTMRPENL